MSQYIILVDLHANYTAQRPITKLARVKKRNTQTKGNLYNNNNNCLTFGREKINKNKIYVRDW
jgi:hypothetical protein